jgi:hypothetical protein
MTYIVFLTKMQYLRIGEVKPCFCYALSIPYLRPAILDFTVYFFHNMTGWFFSSIDIHKIIKSKKAFHKEVSVENQSNLNVHYGYYHIYHACE